MIGGYIQWHILRWKQLKLPWYDSYLVSYKSPNFNLIRYKTLCCQEQFSQSAVHSAPETHVPLQHKVWHSQHKIIIIHYLCPLTILTSFWTISCRHVANVIICRGHEIKSQIIWEWLQMSSQWLLSCAKLHLIDAV